MTAEVLIPEMLALRGESTVARVDRPIGVKRSTSDVTTAMASAPTSTAAWFSLSVTSRKPMWKMSGGFLISPWISKIWSLLNGNRIFVSAGSATQRPTVDTNRTVGETCVSRRNSTAQRNRPMSGATTRIETMAAGTMSQPFSWFR